MPIVLDELLDLCATSTISWTARDTALYALGVGLGREPLDTAELRFVALEPLRTLPSMVATMLVGHLVSAKQMGVRFRGVVHTGQRVIVPHPLPDRGTAHVAAHVVAAYDKGPQDGATIITRAVLTDAETGREIAQSESELLARRDGGFGGPPPPAPRAWTRPDKPADARVEVEVRPDQAILFRLSGDTNPLHVDPEVAGAAGFEVPILQGLCTYGMACRAVQLLTGAETSGLDLAARFSAPVHPGDRLVFELWRRDDEILFQAHAPDRGAIVLKAGRATILDGRGEQA